MNELTVIIPQEQEEITVSAEEQAAEEQANEVKLTVPNQTGDNGATFIPSVSTDGIISWTNDKGLPNPEPVNIKGVPGKDGYNPVKGKDYFDGAPGAPGVSATHKWNGTVLSITSASGTSSADLKGEKGDPGKTPVKGVDIL